MTDKPANVAYNDAAPADERLDAQTQLQKSTMPSALSDLIPRADLLPVIEYIQNDLQEQELSKAFAKPNVIPFPSKAVKDRQEGMQSVYLDDLQVTAMGEWYEKPSIFGFDSMKMMVDQTPILNALIMTRIRQVQRFCGVQQGGKGPGFKIILKDASENASDDQTRSMQLLQTFFLNCGWENRPRHRLRLRRDNFASFMAKITRETLTMDSMPIETEFKRDRNMGLDGIYSVDGSTIRLCTEQGYQGDDEIFALQVVQGRIRAAYTYDDLIYVPRNPRSDVLVGGYGLSETELLVRVVTGFLNAFTYNTKYFDSNSIPKGLLHLSGNYSEQDVATFKRYWNAMVKGVNNAWTLPVMVSKDQESRAAFENFGAQVNEIMFAKWMTFLTSIICAIYGTAPDEINFESFSAGTSSLSGSDTEEKLANSKDKGFRPLLSYYENIFTDFIVSEFSDKYAFHFTGLDDEDSARVFERQKLSMTWDEMRAMDDLPPIGGDIGNAPINPSLLGAWQQSNQQQSEDYGQPGDRQDQDRGGDGSDFGDAGEGNDGEQPDFGADDQQADEGQQQELTKAFGMPVFSIEV